jgi:hypothetical protein
VWAERFCVDLSGTPPTKTSRHTSTIALARELCASFEPWQLHAAALEFVGQERIDGATIGSVNGGEERFNEWYAESVREWYALKRYQWRQIGGALDRFYPSRRVASLQDLDDMAASIVASKANQQLAVQSFDLRMLDEAGWALLPGLLAPEVADALHALTTHLLSTDLHNAFTAHPEKIFTDLQTQSLFGGDEMPGGMRQSNFRVMPLLSRAKAYSALLNSQVVRSLMRAVMKSLPYMIFGYSAYVVGSGSSTGTFHQDGQTHVQAASSHASCVEELGVLPPFCFERGALPDTRVSALVYLNDVSDANGATIMMNGSHAWSGREHADFRAYIESASTVPPQAITVRAPKGSVLLMNAATWHASGAYPQGSGDAGDVPRVALLLAFAPPFLENIKHVFGKHNLASYSLGSSRIWSANSASWLFDHDAST